MNYALVIERKKGKLFSKYDGTTILEIDNKYILIVLSHVAMKQNRSRSKQNNRPASCKLEHLSPTITTMNSSK